MTGQAPEVLTMCGCAVGNFRPLWRGLKALNIDSSEGEGEAEMEAEDEEKAPRRQCLDFNTSVCPLVSSRLIASALSVWVKIKRNNCANMKWHKIVMGLSVQRSEVTFIPDLSPSGGETKESQRFRIFTYAHVFSHGSDLVRTNDRVDLKYHCKRILCVMITIYHQTDYWCMSIQ